jgi:hypothetical protein
MARYKTVGVLMVHVVTVYINIRFLRLDV